MGWDRRWKGMSELIRKSAIEKIVNVYAQAITPETSQQEMIEIISDIIYKSINSIDVRAISEIQAKSMNTQSRGMGI